MYMPANEWKTIKETSNRWYIRNKKKKEEEGEVQNNLTLKSGQHLVSRVWKA